MKSDFYSSTRKQDLYRIPLINPHELISPGGIGYDWFYKVQYKNNIDLDTKDLHIEQVGVQDSLIVLYTSSVYVEHKMSKAWFIIDYKEKLMYTYTTFQTYKEYFQKKESKELLLYNVDDVYSDFKNKVRLPWLESSD